METIAYSIPWRKRHYVARIVGPHDQYVLDREFQKGNPVKAGGGTLKFDLPRGFYEVQYGHAGNRRYYRQNGLGMFPLSEGEQAFLGKAAAGPVPGDAGSWGGERCDCGEPVTMYDRDGFPKCDAHGPEEWQGPEGEAY